MIKKGYARYFDTWGDVVAEHGKVLSSKLACLVKKLVKFYLTLVQLITCGL